ncbi:putative N-acyltransferase [Desulfosalsimonas propionicica]|uniref:Putative N-acyltransferase n=1 Tax=Desulfosalsimonas propionicica TaxID=332175 RepID=A0A7W0CBW7_9BACT|nr:GNAT family N-acetyltransferase [Desulfosalsimonas propionicica]MBA2882899.1 putative N-acyltransferase [Desulfosalsimonas propionicica]
MTQIQIAPITTTENWQKLESGWNTLLASSAAPSFFLTYEWLRAWEECFLSSNQRLYILAFYEKQSLVAAAPFYLTRKKAGPLCYNEIKFLGAPQAGSDYLDVIMKKGREKTVAEACYQYLTGPAAPKWDTLSLTDIFAGSLFLLHFINCIQQQGQYFKTAPSAFCPAAEITPDFDTYFAELSKWRKKKFRQDLRVLYRDHKAAHLTFEGKPAADHLSAFFDFYNQKSPWPGQGPQKILNKYSALCGENPPVQLDILEADGKIAAGLLHLRYKKSLYMYQMAVDREFNPRLSLGNLLVGMCVKNAAEAGYITYDFLKGHEDYKFHWANTGRRTLKLQLWNKRPVSRALALANLGKNAGKIVLR